MNESKTYRSLQEFTQEQIHRFDTMHSALREFNSELRKGMPVLPPDFSDQEMNEYSTYRQLLLEPKVND
jgi:hypothetical protein